MKHFASPQFWRSLEALPDRTQNLARENFSLLKANPQHPSLHLKRVGSFWSVRVGLGYRALGVDVESGILWFWIGTHAEYDKLTS